MRQVGVKVTVQYHDNMDAGRMNQDAHLPSILSFCLFIHFCINYTIVRCKFTGQTQ